jgi:hypothetical protein
VPTPLIDSSHYPAIRAAIDVSLGPAQLPDAVLALSIYVPAAIDDVLSRDPLAESRSGAELVRVQNAAVYFAAGRAVPATPVVESQQFADFRYQRAKVDQAERQRDLFGRAESELAAVLNVVSPDTDARPTVFARAPGGRGR